MSHGKKLRRAHIKGEHAAVPVFGCLMCIAARDSYWVCACEPVRSHKRSVDWCAECKKLQPGLVIETALVPNTTPVKAESSR